MNYLYYGDNLEVLRESVPSASVDLVYLDPPFNSNRSYNVLFADRSGKAAQAQIEAFDDTWTWSQDTEAAFKELVRGDAPVRVAEAIDAMRRLLGDNDVLAYLVMMTQRLVELHRVLKSTGSLYLHCDPTASHYLKVMLDAVFGPTCFRNEVIWERTHSHNMRAKTWPKTNDVILFYTKTQKYYFEHQFTDYGPEQLGRFKEDEQGRLYKAENLTFSTPNPSRQFEWRGAKPPPSRSWGMSREQLEKLYAQGRILLKKDGTPRLDGWKIYLEETRGKPVGSNWSDIPRVSNTSAERLGYPTQKPEALLGRIIGASSNEGDTVLDPFCGCGTTIAVAQRLRRQWVGIDITYLAVDLIDKRLRDTYGDDVRATYEVRGIPRDVDGARALFQANPFDFERWAVSRVDGQPHQRSEQAGDKGVDGWIRFPASEREIGRAIVSVKGGHQLNPGMVRDLRGTVESQRADMGVLITLEPPTDGMLKEARRSGSYMHPTTGHSYPCVQVITVSDLLAGRQPHMPSAFLPYVKARRVGMAQQGTFGV
ncbi:MAG: restriction endonuclease [Actinomycetota bacterium]|nr:restriction endonuclease [Actinomycetota bacterium]